MAAKILKESEQSKVSAHLDYLVNRIGPRLTSSDNLQTACEWARDEFAAMGLTARLEEWGTFPVGFNRGPWSGRMTKPEAMEFTFKTDAWTAGTKGRARGPLLAMPATADAVRQLGEKAKGAWFLVVGGRRNARRGGQSGQGIGRILAELGAHGMVTGGRDLLVTSGRGRQANYKKLPELPVVNMVADQYQKLRGLLEKGEAVEVEFDIRNHFKKGPIKLYNVIAELKGSQFPDEIVIVGGHIDSWDGATGTTDNGTGVATTMEAARLLTTVGAKPKRTIRFMLWGGEEQGLLGSRAYIAKHPEENAKVSAVLVHDGGTNHVSGITGLAPMIPALEKAFQPVLAAKLKLPFRVVTIPRFRRIGSDQDSYIAEGVPGFFWMQSGRAVYRNTHHTQHDTFDAAIEEYQIHSSRVIALGALGIANLPEMLSRDGFEPGRRIRTRSSGPVINRRAFGIRTRDLVITAVRAKSVAAVAGVAVEDKVISIGKMEITNDNQISRALRAAGKKFSVVVARGGKKLTLNAEFKN